MIPKPIRPLAIFLTLMAETCVAAVGPDYHAPKIALTAAYLAPTGAAQAPPSERWWDGFKDPVLSQLVAAALERNLDLAAARARVLRSRAAARAAGAALTPHGEVSGAAANEEQSLLSPIGEIGRHLPGYQRRVDQYDLGAAASWEIDLFGGLRRAREGARAEAGASVADLQSTRLTVAAETADAYLEIRAYQARLRLARRQERVRADLVALVRQRFDQGVASDRELNQAQAELEGVQAEIPRLTAGLAAQSNRLDILLGSQAGAWRAALTADADIPSAPAVSTADGPAALLRRRPDVLAAEARLLAANAAIGAAIADYYPKVSITGLLGLESIDASQIFTGDAMQHQLGAGLRWRLFDFGRVDAEVAQARGQYAERLAAWRGTVYRATGEVETALSDLTEDQARAASLSRQIADLTAARDQAQKAYESGVVSLIEVRDADRDLLAASDQLAQTRADAAIAAVEAYRALGGGWGAAPEAGL